MNIQSILFPTDFSHSNDAALEYASTLAAEAGAKLHIVHVHDIRDLTTATGEASYMYVPTWNEEFEIASRRLKEVAPTVSGVACEYHCLKGAPDEEIVTLAADKSIDLIVMASHGRTGLSRLLMGSVAEGVMRRAPCPVLVIKQPANKSDATIQAAVYGTKTGTPK